MLLLVVAAIAGGVLLLFFETKALGIENIIQGEWIQFYAKGKDSGFSFKELELLRSLALKSRLEDPTALFWSSRQLDRCMKEALQEIREKGEDKDQRMQKFLSKLYDYRKKLELEKPDALHSLKDTRRIPERQRLRVLANEIGVFDSRVIKNTKDGITIALPSGPNIPPAFHWEGVPLSVHFWRNEDAGYVFETSVIDKTDSGGIATLRINHADSISRTQKRRSLRRKIQIPACLYLPDSKNGAHETTKPGLNCIIEDLSDGGCALVVGGKTAPGLRIKVQFELSGNLLTMHGVVRSVDYREAQNRSVLHIEADPLPLEAKNTILAEVFGISGNGESPPEENKQPAVTANKEKREERVSNDDISGTSEEFPDHAATE
jgi:c-di-GMP-binding flagellar brake protein YcgR